MKKKIFIPVILLLQICSLKLPAQSITCPANRTVSTNPGVCFATVSNLDPVVTPSGTQFNYYISSINETGVGSVSGKNFPIGLHNVTYRLYDHPEVYCSFTVKVEDHEPPVITCPPNITVNCANDIPQPGGVTAVDGCTQSGFINVQFISDVKTNETCFNRYTITRTYKATDDYGNSSTCSQTIIVNDTIPPYFLQPPPISPLNVACSSNVPLPGDYNFTAYDDCAPIGEDGEVLVDFKQVKTAGSCANKYTLTRTWTAADFCGNKKVYTQVINVNDSIGPEFIDPLPAPTLDIACASEIPTAPTLRAQDNCYPETATVSFFETRSDEQCANKFKLTRTWIATDECGNSTTHTQVIRVNDTQPPVFDGSPPPLINVSCEKDIPAPAQQTATDNCGNVTITLKELKTNVQCANRFTLTRTWTATDACGNSSTRRQMINVYDDEPPKITSVSADPVVLWPPNHKMRDVTINYSATDNCGVTSSLSVSSSDPVNGGSDGDQSPDWEIIDAHHVKLRAEKANNGQARYYNIKITITDGCNASVDTTIQVVVAHNITSPQTGNPYKVGSTVSLGGVFWDKPNNTHTAKWLLDGNVAANGTVIEPSGNQNGKVNGNYKFNAAGVYKLQMNVTDQNGLTSYANTNNDLDAIVVIYDPNGGNAYGGGWFTSVAGSLTSDPAAEGKASYGFAVNYRNAAKPKGETQFEFKVGSFEFNALNFDYLSINGAKAQFKGTGKIIGGQSGIGFIMTVTDGAVDGSNTDKIRMKIYNRNTGYVYYDNQPGANDAEIPSTEVGANSSIVIQNLSANINKVTQEVTNKNNTEKRFDKLELLAYPNPSYKDFSIRINSNDLKTNLQLQVFDQHGRLVEKHEKPMIGSTIRLGETYQLGVYYLRVTQGQQHKEIKLIKIFK